VCCCSKIRKIITLQSRQGLLSSAGCFCLKKLFAYLFLTISPKPLMSKSTGPIFAKYSGSVELRLRMISLKLVSRSPKGRCHSSRVLLVLVHGCRWTQAASGAAGRANVGPCRASSRTASVGIGGDDWRRVHGGEWLAAAERRQAYRRDLQHGAEQPALTADTWQQT